MWPLIEQKSFTRAVGQIMESRGKGPIVYVKSFSDKEHFKIVSTVVVAALDVGSTSLEFPVWQRNIMPVLGLLGGSRAHHLNSGKYSAACKQFLSG